MKLTLRYKLFIGLTLLNFVISALFATFLYRTSSERFFNKFRSHQLSITRFLSTAIDGDEHRRFTSPDDMKKPLYRYYLKLLQGVYLNEKDIRYLYTLNYDRDNDRLRYAIEGNIPDHDVLWLETSHFAFSLFYNKQERLTAEYNRSYYTEDFTVDTDLGKISVRIRKRPDGDAVVIQGATAVVIKSTDPFAAETGGGIITRSRRVAEATLAINGRRVPCTLTYTARGEPSSYPGDAFIENESLMKEIKQIIGSGKSFTEIEPADSAYGVFMSAYSVITDSAGKGIGVVITDVSLREIDEMKRDFFRTAIMIFVVTFAFSLMLTLVLSSHFSKPVARLKRGVEQLSRGDLSTLVDINTSDEFGMLAAGFNEMVRNLDSASKEQRRLIEEIRQLNEGLERRVEERTRTIQDQANELNGQIIMARRIQMSLLPQDLPDVRSMVISYRYRPMMAVGGDFIDFHYNGSELMLFICDVSGHGVPAAFLSVMVKMSLPSCYEVGRHPAKALVRLHEALSGKMGGHFISAAFCHIDLAAGTMVMANAGHPPLILLRNGGGIEYLRPAGKVIIDDFPPGPGEAAVKLAAGDRIILYTDGIVEARNPAMELFGEARLKDFIRGNAAIPPDSLCAGIYDSVIEYAGAGNAEMEDDITLIVAEYRG